VVSLKPDVYTKVEKRYTEKLQQLPDFICDFLFSIQKKQIRTRLEYAKDLGIFLEYLHSTDKFSNKNVMDFTDKDMDLLDERDIWNFLSYLTSYNKTFLTATGKSKTQRFTNGDVGKSRKIATIHEIFSYLFDKELIAKDVSRKVDITLHAKKKIKDRLDFKDIEKFYSTIIDDVNIENVRKQIFHEKVKFRDYIMVLIFSYTGIRVSELVQLDVNEISIDKKAMVVVRKGGDQEKVPIPSRILEDIADYIERRKQMTWLEGEAKNALFISLHKKRIDPRTVRQMLEKYRQRAGIDIKITPHVFRRTFGTRHYNRYRDMFLTAKIMGHTSAETTRRFYADPDEERIAGSMDVFDYETETAQIDKEEEMKIMLKRIEKLAKDSGIDVTKLLINQ
jgi:Site-specific recombinase XerD